ncbi:TPA: hypothetical protein SHW33_004007 [Clostridioides difficile]|uniref:hypothetical protein n=1 Tax=Clostridioides difficile TaxID=1496 RepID=UPI0003B1D0D1|nr:hypothetical protein [Clostridioides difficile]EGT2232880.1 hypothetical protein [Clostridioides difficile]EGT4168029.1 hypothetical protein [Clostridioides difficile]EGT4674163.1 hypothetical protein [Clostridioides difficile]EGT5104808.1 hypothetical protein [Clostridioides difficile]EKG0766217.1 hypothetical protein [Clostridioides difficile]
MTFKELVNKVRNLVLEAKNVTIEDTESKFTSENVEGALKECIDRADEAFQEADSGKTLLSTAIGSPATSEQTFQDYANYITGFKNTIVSKDNTINSLRNRYQSTSGFFIYDKEHYPNGIVVGFKPDIVSYTTTNLVGEKYYCIYTPLFYFFYNARTKETCFDSTDSHRGIDIKDNSWLPKGPVNGGAGYDYIAVKYR